jgi:hypothetical protein
MRAPMAPPMSAAARAGASFTPSPTIITGPVLRSLRTKSTFWSGVSSDLTASSASPLVTPSATARRSPVASRIRETPSLRRLDRNSAVPDRSASAITTWHTRFPSTLGCCATDAWAWEPLSRQYHNTQTISAVPRALKRFMSAMQMWISAVCRSGSRAAMRSPKAFKQHIFASIWLRA